MNIEYRSVHFNLSEKENEYLNQKFERLNYAKDLIVDLMIIITKEKAFKLEATVKFRWGHQGYIEESEFDLMSGIDKLIDRLEQKISKEKGKIQEHKGAANNPASF